MKFQFPRNARLAGRLDPLSRGVAGFRASALSDVGFMRSDAYYPSMPVTYHPSIVVIAQGRKNGRLGNRKFTYDAENYLVLSVPLPFECETVGSPDEPMIGLSVRVNPATVAELLLEMDVRPLAGSPNAIDAIPLTPELRDAAERLADALASPAEARILGPQIVREIIYRALCGGQGAALQALAAPQSHFGQIARALRKIHEGFSSRIEIAMLARDAGMSVSAFHTHFKSVTAMPPQRYLQTIRLQKAHALMVAGMSAAEAAVRVGYESPSQFNREFKRLFGDTPRAVAMRSRGVLLEF